MERKNNRRNGYSGRVVLYAVMAGFCVLALIEIIYGRIHSQAKQEQGGLQEEKVLQEDNDIQLQQELRAETEGNGDGNKAADIPEIPLQGAPPSEAEGGKNGAGDASGVNEAGGQDEAAAENVSNKNSAAGDSFGSSGNNTPNSTEMHDMQIVFMGDSILDSVREYDGVAYLISQACNADVYNLSIGGTTAALMEGEQYSFDEWTSCSLLGVVHAILGDIDTKVFEPYRAGEILKECDFSKTDYFVIEYGVNDFLAKIPDSQYTNDGELRGIDALHTYVGALNAAIGALHNAFPTAKILLISPHYCQFFNGDTFIGDTYSLDYGYGPMIDYSELCGYVYNENKDKNVIYYNSILESGIDAYSADDYLEDGIHLTSEGRHVYADYAARLINADFRKNE